MRKLSEIFEVVKPYHVSYGGKEVGMCDAAYMAYKYAVISADECSCISDFCEELVEESRKGIVTDFRILYLYKIVQLRCFPHLSECYPHLSGFIKQHPEIADTLGQIYDAIVDKLVLEGK